ncbi:hypothetical protein D3C72_750920 [compost metagenome]
MGEALRITDAGNKSGQPLLLRKCGRGINGRLPSCRIEHPHGADQSGCEIFDSLDEFFEKILDTRGGDNHLKNMRLRLKQSFRSLFLGYIPRGADHADDVAGLVLQRHARHHEPAVDIATHGAFFVTEIRFAGAHDPRLGIGNAGTPRGFTVNIVIGEPDQLLDRVKAIFGDDGPIGEKEASFQILGIDKIRYVVDHRFQKRVPVGGIGILAHGRSGRWRDTALFSRHPVLLGCLRAFGTHLSASLLCKEAE